MDELSYVEEQQDYDSVESPPRSDRSGPGDYSVPHANREVWKQFGCNTQAGRALRKLYGGTPQTAGGKVSYPRLPSPAKRWEPELGPRKPCPQRATVQVPKPLRLPKIDPDDPRNWRFPLPGRKAEADIKAEMHLFNPEKPTSARPGRDQNAAKRALQNHFQYCGGRMLPPSAMGHVPKGSIPEPAVNLAKERRQADENGMTAEQREIFQDITNSIKEKRAQLDAIDAATSHQISSKLKTKMNKEALQLRNEINECIKDIDKLLELTVC